MRGSPLVKTDSKAPNQFRFIVFDGRKGVALYGVADGKLQESHWLAQFSGFWYISGSNPAISPNGRWIYLPMHADTAVIDLQERRLRWLGRARRLSDGGYIPEVYQLRWSPNSHYLLGQRIGVDEGLILCQPLQRGYQVLVKEGVYAYGWYPDSQRIWYVQRDAEGRSVLVEYSVSPLQPLRKGFRREVISRGGSRFGSLHTTGFLCAICVICVICAF
jgi:hypothetical protein